MSLRESFESVEHYVRTCSTYVNVSTLAIALAG